MGRRRGPSPAEKVSRSRGKRRDLSSEFRLREFATGKKIDVLINNIDFRREPNQLGFSPAAPAGPLPAPKTWEIKSNLTSLRLSRAFSFRPGRRRPALALAFPPTRTARRQRTYAPERRHVSPPGKLLAGRRRIRTAYGPAELRSNASAGRLRAATNGRRIVAPDRSPSLTLTSVPVPIRNGSMRSLVRGKIGTSELPNGDGLRDSPTRNTDCDAAF